MMRLDLATDDYIGARSQQQDSAAARSFGSSGGAVLVLADGLGGHTGGAEASRIVIETFRDAADTGIFDEEVARRSGLRATLEKANERIAVGVDPAHGQRGMASTAVAVVLADGLVHWISVGDSHLYVWRSGRLAKLNEDHSQAGLMVRSGQFKPGDPEVAAAKSVLVSALTGRKLEIVDHPANAFAVQPGDIVLLASDGLNSLSEQEIQDIVGAVQEQGARQIGVALLDHVRERRLERQDNTAVVVARIIEVPARLSEPATEIAAETQRVTAPTVVTGLALAPERATQRKTEVAKPDAGSQPVQAIAVAKAPPVGATPPPTPPVPPGPVADAAFEVTETPQSRAALPAGRPPLPQRRSGPPPGLVAKLMFGVAVAVAVAGTILVLKLPKDAGPSATDGRGGAAVTGPAGTATAPAGGTSAPATPAQTLPETGRVHIHIRQAPASEPTRTPGAPAPLPAPIGQGGEPQPRGGDAVERDGRATPVPPAREQPSR